MLMAKGFALLVTAVLALAAVPARAVEPETQEGIILRNTVSDGYRYVDNFVPSTTGAFTLLADRDNIVTLVQTLEYYWPLSRQIYASLDTLRRPVEGKLRISRDGKVVMELAAEPLVIISPDGIDRPGGRVLTGEEALAEYARFQAAIRQHHQAVTAASQDRARYEVDLRAAAIARIKGEVAPPLRPPLADPPSLRLNVSEPVRGYRVRLAEGRYQLAAIDYGSIVEGSERDVLVVAGEVQSAVVLDIVPEERWTRVLMSNSAADDIHAAPGRTFYVALQRADRFDHQQHEQLVNPQALGVAGRQVWVRRAPAIDQRLEWSVDGRSWQRLVLADYRVRQTRGSDLGYAIEPAAAGETAEISAYAVAIPADAAGGVIQLRIVGAETGVAVPGSQRRIHVVVAVPPIKLYALATLPLAIGVGMFFYRRRGRRRAGGDAD